MACPTDLKYRNNYPFFFAQVSSETNEFGNLILLEAQNDSRGWHSYSQSEPITLCHIKHIAFIQRRHMFLLEYNNRGKSVPLRAWSGPEGSRKLRFPDFVTTAQGGGKVVSLTHRSHLPPRKSSWYSFLLEAESTPGP